jgi:hypothetical protein
MTMALSNPARASRLAIVCVSLLAALPAPRAQTHLSMFGKTSVDKPEAGTAGDWPGTWYYASRIRRMAVWVRDEGGEPRIMMQIQGSGHPSEALLTGWDGSAAYDVGGIPGTFQLTIDRSDATTIEGTWFWEWGTPLDGKRETAEFTIYRFGDGRQLVWLLKNFHEQHWGDAEYEIKQPEMVWVFRKASRREALWGELPF